MVQICALASGSNGNCYFIGNEEEGLLIDAGISRRLLLSRMKEVGIEIEKIRAVFVTHEHSDHSKGVRFLSHKHQIPVYMTPLTFERSRPQNRPDKYTPFNPGDTIAMGAFNVHSFSKNHDAAQPCSFVVEIGNRKIGVMTDIGRACENVVTHFSQCHAIFLETNYDEKMLWNGPYPWYLKNRVSSDVGHLSNDQAFELVEKHRSPHLEVVYLSHISQENNHPELAKSVFEPLSDKIDIRLTSRLSPTEIYSLSINL
jgi:phosphoribosyl 1,2-cyclic phosphodiesterase